jgi:hypothetical protein
MTVPVTILVLQILRSPKPDRGALLHLAAGVLSGGVVNNIRGTTLAR